MKKSKKENFGYDAKNKRYVDLPESGILDSSKVLRVSLENAISTASTILLIDKVIYPESKEENSSTSGTGDVPVM